MHTLNGGGLLTGTFLGLGGKPSALLCALDANGRPVSVHDIFKSVQAVTQGPHYTQAISAEGTLSWLSTLGQHSQPGISFHSCG